VHIEGCEGNVCGIVGVRLVNIVRERQAAALVNLLTQGVLTMPELIPGGFGALLMRQFLMTEGQRMRARLENMPREVATTSTH